MEAVRAGADARTRLELALVKAAKPEVDASMRALLARIERLEGGGSSSTRCPRNARRRRRPQSPPVIGRRIRAARGRGRRSRSRSRRSRPLPIDPRRGRSSRTRHRGVEARRVETARVEAAQGDRPAVRPQAPAAAQAIVEDLAPLLAWWPAVVELVRNDNALLGACIEEARPVQVTGEDLTVAFSATAPFLKKKAENPDNRAAVTAALRDVTGRRWRLSYELHDELVSAGGEGRETLSEEEWLRRFIDEFDAEELPADAEADGAPGENGENGAGSPAGPGGAVTNEQEGA